MTYPARPTLALRIGITGARGLDEAHTPRLAAQLQAVLQAAQQHLRRLAAKDAGVGERYHHASGGKPEPLLRLITPLARGADRLAARAALALGYALHVPMPFPQAEYEKDFDTAEDLAEFRALLAEAGADQLALDGDHGPEVNRAYEAVGRYVVRHSDLLIAIWDGGPGSGRGGTADIVRYAANTGVPVWWLHAAEDRPPVWIADIQDLRYPKPTPTDPWKALQDRLERLIRPPAPCHRHRHGIVGCLARLFQARHVAPEAEHFGERPLKRPWPWKAYAWFMRRASGLKSDWIEPLQPDDPVARYWFDRYQPTDARAGDYAARYRSAYVWVIGLGTAAVVLGAFALVFGLLDLGLPGVFDYAATGFAILELAALGLIFLLVVGATRREWHERSIEYRLLAELFRKQQVLAPLGWALPVTAVQRMATPDDPADNRAAWVASLFAAEQRAAPLPRGSLTEAVQGKPRRAILEELIAEQRRYHDGRLTVNTKAGRTLVHFGEGLFVFVLLCVTAKVLIGLLGQVPEVVAVILAFLATVLPAVSGAFVGIRAYAELQLMAEQSRHMVAELDRAEHRVERLDPTRPLVSQDLGAEAAAIAALMLQDLEGWARLFRVKGIEAG